MGALERATDSLWSGRSRVEELASIAATVVDEAHRTLDGATYPGFSANVGGFLPANAPPPFALWSHLASLRYLRADAHALAWTDAEITFPEIQILSFLRHSQAPSDVEGFGSIFGASGKRLLDALDSLQRRGFVATMEGGWTITPSGRAAREAIERATNAQNGVAYGTLSKAHRNAFLTGLAELPSERAMSEMQEYDDSVG